LGRTLQVLVADDDPGVLLLLRALEELEDVEVTTANDGLDALEKARAGRFDVFVFDIMMPGLDGVELAREVRADADLKPVPIIFVTARSDDETKAAARSAGGDLFLTKPISMNDLSRAITDLAAGRKKRRRRRT
jgi:two-component system alkaline phosphatase synthesis response regulator PhoP